MHHRILARCLQCKKLDPFGQWVEINSEGDHFQFSLMISRQDNVLINPKCNKLFAVNLQHKNLILSNQVRQISTQY
jgi:hypothetical protein